MAFLNLCTSCGSKLTTQDIYCPNCGFMNKSSILYSQTTPEKQSFFSLVAFGWGLMCIILSLIITSLKNRIAFLVPSNLYDISFLITFLIILVILYVSTKKLITKIPSLTNLLYIKKNLFSVILGPLLLSILLFVIFMVQNLNVTEMMSYLLVVFYFSILSVFSFLGILFLIDYASKLPTIDHGNSSKYNALKIPFIIGITTGFLYIIKTFFNQILLNQSQSFGINSYIILLELFSIFIIINPPIVIYFLYRNKKINLFQQKRIIFLILNLMVIIITEELIYIPGLIIMQGFPLTIFNTFSNNWLFIFTAPLSNSIFILLGMLSGLCILNYDTMKTKQLQ